MLGQLYERALHGERCWVRFDDGELTVLPVQRWLGDRGADPAFDNALVAICDGATIELGCGPGRLIAHLIRRGVPALGVDHSAAAVGLAWRRGAPALLGDIFEPLPGVGRWRTVLLADGNIGLGGDPRRVLTRAAQLLSPGGRCVVELAGTTTGVQVRWVRLETDDTVGPWFRWAWVGADSAQRLASQSELVLTGIHRVGDRVVATLAAPQGNGACSTPGPNDGGRSEDFPSRRGQVSGITDW